MPGNTHNHQQCITEALATAGRLCASRNVRFTAIRKRVLELLWENHKAQKAYDILTQLQKEDPSAKPITVYRALDFLLEAGLVHKVSSLNAFVGCSHPAISCHACQFIICECCGEVVEFCAPEITRQITEKMQERGFAITRQTVEVLGVCGRCKR